MPKYNVRIIAYNVCLWLCYQTVIPNHYTCSMNLSKQWHEAVDTVTFAFQSIRDFHTGEIYAYEALLRSCTDAGFASIDAFFEQAYSDGVLVTVDHLLRIKALRLFKDICDKGKIKLFYNLDNRIIDMPDYESGKTIELLKELDLPQGCITFELSEKHRFENFPDANEVLKVYKNQGFTIAIDDFGTGYSGMKLLYESAPDFIKVDRFFINNIEKSPKKELLIRGLLTVAKALHFKTIAEGIETEDEYIYCKKLGFDLAQGYYLDYPALIESIKESPERSEKNSIAV